MKNIRILQLLMMGVFIVFSHSFASNEDTKGTSRSLAEWTVVAYIQADNNLAPYAVYNIGDMQLAPLSSSLVNMLVQWDQPNNNKTWRYRIVKGGRIEDASVSVEMGLNPVQELVDMTKWAKTKYDAKRFCVILWNHGSGVVDPSYRATNKAISNALGTDDGRPHMPWLEIPGFDAQRDAQDRGILFDDSQLTYLNAQGLATAFSRIKSEVMGGRKIDIVGMDACLMAMLEVGYQIKDSVNYLVSSEDTEPGEGWSYSGFLKTLCALPAVEAPSFANAIVNAYANFYQSRTRYYTQSAINLNKLELVKQNIAQVITGVAACRKIDSTRTKRAVVNARRASKSFDVSDYIDLYSFYSALSAQLAQKDSRASRRYITAATNLRSIVASGMQLILNSVTANRVGSYYTNVKGISIYYPRGTVHSSYRNTKFAQSTSWISFVQTYR
jgi:hypothetical protein